MPRKRKQTRQSRETDKNRKRLARIKNKEDCDQENDNQISGSSRTVQPAEASVFHESDKELVRSARPIQQQEDLDQENDNQIPGSSRTLQPAEVLAFYEFPVNLQGYFKGQNNTTCTSNSHANKKTDIIAKKKAEAAKRYRERYNNDDEYRERKKNSSREYYLKKHKGDSKYQHDKRRNDKHSYSTNTNLNKKKKQSDNIRYWTDKRYKLIKMQSSIFRYASNPAYRNILRLYSTGKYASNPLFAAKVRNASKTNYRNNAALKEKKKSFSKTNYKTNEPFRESVKTSSRLKYKTNEPFRESVKTSSRLKYKTNEPFRESVKTSSKLKYKTNEPFRESVKTSSKLKYKTKEPFRESVKTSSKLKYKTNEPFRESIKTSSKLKYKTNKPFRESVKTSSKLKYKTNDPFRESVKTSSKLKYKTKEPFRESVKTYSKLKYMRFHSFRNNLKASSIKKYASNPLFRNRIKTFLHMKYHNSTIIRETKKRRVNMYRSSVLKAIKTFNKSVKDVPVYICTVCTRMFYKSQVKCCKHSKYSIEGTMSDIASECITGKFVHQCTDICKVNCHKSKEWICYTCDRHLQAGNMPPQALANGLALPDIPPQLKTLNNMERQLVALRIPFMKVISLPKGGQKGVKGPCINVPSDLNSVTSTLPRPLNDSQMIKVKLKRKLIYKGYQLYEWIDPKNVQEALQYLIKHNKWYTNITINNVWYDENDSDLIQNADMDINENDRNNDSIDCDGSDVKNERYDINNVQIPERDKNNSNIIQNAEIHIVAPGHNITREQTSEIHSENATMETGDVGSNNEESHEEIPSYPVETCLQPIDLGQEVLDTNGRIFCIAPAEKQTPRSIFNDEGMDAMSFPHLLPDGDFGFSMDRHIKLTPSKYFNARLLSADTRFASDLQFIFFAQYVTEITDIRSKISIALRKGRGTTTDGKMINAGMLRTPESVQSMLKSDIGYRFLQPIRGSPPYWERTMKDLYSMIRQIGIPTFFLTFSAGETRWNDFIDTLVNIGDDYTNPNELEWLDKCKLIKDNPVMCARLFDHRVKALFSDLLMSPAKPIGKVIDFFIRTEFQQRGSPHIHCLVWIEDAPRLDVNTDAEICQFIDKHISCKLPNKNDDQQLYDIVSAVQIHSKQHTKSCRKHSTTCRFNFPRPPVKETFIARPNDEGRQDNDNSAQRIPISVEDINKLCKPQRPAKSILKDVWTVMSTCENIENLTLNELFRLANTTYQEYVDCLKSVTTKNVIHPKRDLTDSYVNNYNKYLLKAWNANIDIQFVTDVYSCVAYILSYINKSESEMSELLVNAKKEAVEGNNSNKETMKKIGQVYMGNREVSAQEAVYRVCSFKLKDSSRQVIFIPTGNNTLKLSLPITAMKSKESTDENVWATTILERYYARLYHPDFDNMCLADFASGFSVFPASRKPKSSKKLPVHKLKNGLGFIKRKKNGKENIIRYPRFNSKKNPEEYHMTLLQLYIPHREPNVKPDEFVSHEDYVQRGIMPDGRSVIDIINTNRQRFEKDVEQLNQALEDIQDGNIHQDAWGMIAPEAEAERIELQEDREIRIPDDEEEAIPELDISKGHRNNSHNFPHPLELSQPKFPVKYTKELMRKLNDKQKEVFYAIRQWCIDVTLKKQPEPFHIFLTGGAGTGKTHLVKAIYAEATRILSKSVSPPNSSTVVLTAPTGTAAYNVKGATIHTVFSLSKMLTIPYKPLGESTLNTLRQKLEHLKILVIDEISMVDMKLLSYVHGRLCQIKHCKQYFGNVSILAVGDFYQLSPVRASPLYKELRTVQIDLWNPLFKIVQLTEIMRQKDDVEFAMLLNRIRTHLKGKPLSEQDLTLLQSVSTKETPDTVSTALHVYPTNSEVSNHNSKIMKQICQSTVFVKAKDFFKNSVSGQLNERQEPFATRQGENLDDIIELGLNARVMLIRNMDVEDGLVNGAFGTITAIERIHNDNIQAVYVRFDNEQTGKATVAKQVASRNAPKNSVRISRYEENLKGKNAIRKQFPLRLGFASTIHKVQGLTVKELVVSLRKTFEAGMAYVALSRVTSLAGLHLIDFDPGVLYSSEDIALALDAMEPFIGLTFLPLNGDTSSIVISLHNTEGLLPHKDDIKAAQFVHDSDIICFTETWLNSNANISHILPTFIYFSKPRSEAYSSTLEPYNTFSQAERGGVGTFIHQDLDFCQKIFTNTNMECVTAIINCGFKFLLVNIYRPQFYPIQLFCSNLTKFLQQLEQENIPVMCIGDFNDNAFGNRPKVIALFSSFKYTQIVKDSTTEAGTCLDLVFVKNFERVPSCTVVPQYYSFHEAVQICVPILP